MVTKKLLSTIFLSIGICTSINASADQGELAKGKYLVEIGGCNDCHTSGFAPSGGKTPEKQWLLGDRLGYRGPWGTTYPTNLRLYMSELSEQQWLAKAKVIETRPPMPWWVLNRMTEEDLSLIYRYITSLGPLESPVPSYVPPDKEPQPPFIQWPMPPS